MLITVVDASNYLKGLLVLIRRDGEISARERTLLMDVGKSLGFEKEFCRQSIDDILENRFIDDSPPIFPTRELARRFIKDALAVAWADGPIQETEKEWLERTAHMNDLTSDWLVAELKAATRSRVQKPDLESYALVICPSLGINQG